MLYCKAKSKNEEYRKEVLRRGLFSAPTYLKEEDNFRIDDYGQ
jgi:2-hydroxychromene-2-carboxylate isomerase